MKYEGNEVKIIKEYKNFILVEHEKGYKECINKQELKLIKKAKKQIKLRKIKGKEYTCKKNN